MASNQSDLTSVDWTQLPKPEDDGAAAHLVGQNLPSIALESTSRTHIDLSALRGTTVLYAYPMTGQPDVALPEGWDMIPGARGCTPQSCAFRDHAQDLYTLGVDHIFGLSAQDSVWQQEAVSRLHLPFALLSDASGALREAIRLPSFQCGNDVLLKRLTMIIRDGKVSDIIYPVFPPDENAAQVIRLLGAAAASSHPTDA